ncbi:MULTISPECIES: thioesterase family protein [unclassified Mycolicibacterium]|uniref:thioesterase family protein n=1 Tax=unclassified Mycolicibacterium TaxID=2636767 RepID=UPI0012DFD610|nr:MULTISPECIES: thioesterase family protein [unclassified Mycolicibacterium]MUL82190.1 thioesterase family protein [Mycolicibacterium sp. CBMA 329]MUL87956.1 thioesterase family protein [Mycolicibacterium sp. CBMA 331]MUM02287.1 thioesterase family protein [Mycolicibacterium sp. CBMA 334]MUM26429.1 thioesterase family protein [Mycolicibacterium sp. CBMA 295]MUM38253.1 thioesterase family protein [Mycolicibacterium sp. CBMA 247]
MLTRTSPFTELTALRELGPDRFSATVDPMWTIGPKVHGGCMMAICAAAARRSVLIAGASSALQPIAVSANYLAAPDPGELQATTILRKLGRQVCAVDVQLSQGDRVAVTAAVTLGMLDDGDPRHQEPLALTEMPAEPTADAVHVTPDHPMGQIVHVAQGCDLRVDPSAALFLTGRQGDPINRMWLRPFSADEDDTDTALLFALMAGDISAPVTMNRGMFGWAPTVQLTTYLRRRPSPGWLRVMANSTVMGTTWFEEDHLILDATGAVVVQSRQLAMIPKGA